jgi:Phytanoyl-CoA dioxygenase (PhyH)
MNYLIEKVSNHLLKQIYRIPLIEKKSEQAYQEALQKYINNIPLIPLEDANLIATIKDEGIAITSLDNLGINSTAEMLKTADDLSCLLKNYSDYKKNEYTIHATINQMVQQPEILLWGLEERILRIAESYFGLPVAYQGAYLRRDFVNQVETQSRLWHIDTEDRQVFKVIIYLHDMHEDNGPFQYIPKDITSKVAQELNYKSGYVQAQRMQEIIPPTNYKSCLGSAGTVVFAATSSIFHRGKLPISSERFAIFFDYTSRFPKYPVHSQSLFSPDDLLLLSENLSEYQRQCLLWREYTWH